MRKYIGLLAVSVAVLGVSSRVRAVTVYDSGGFDDLTRFTPTYTNPLDPLVIGNLRGQDSTVAPGHSMWFEAGTAGNPASAGPPPVAAVNGNTFSTAVIENTVFNSTPQAVRVDYRGTDNRWAPKVSITPTATLNNVLVTWNERYTTDAATFGPFFGEEGYDRSGTIHRLGGLGVDATTQQIIYFNASDIANSGIEVGPTITPNVFHSFAMLYNYTTQKYSVSVDSTLIASNIPFENSATTFTDADIASLNIGGNSAVPGTAYFDDYVVSSVPEPTTFALAAVIAGGAILRRPKRATL